MTPAGSATARMTGSVDGGRAVTALAGARILAGLA